MKIVKVSINSPSKGLLRQTPSKDGIWGNYKFFINEDIEECDFWVVYSKGLKHDESVKVAPDNMIFISGEPEPVYHYSMRFIKNFSTIVTSRNDIKHKNIIHMQPAQPWWVGRKMNSAEEIDFTLDFNDLKNSPEKRKLISVISSNKAFTKGHIDRIKFVNKLKEHFGNSLDVFGKGINGFEDKWDTLRDYKYHIAIENSSFPDYWTEKLADSFLAESFPFYYGCKNLDKYFSKDSYRLIDISNVDKSIDIIEQVINSNLYEINYEALIESKCRVLYEHNIFPLICSICDEMEISRPKKYVKLKHELSYFDIYKIQMILKRIYFNSLYL